MSNYELYNKVLSALNEDEGTFNAAARNWVEGAEDVHFEDAEANDLFYTAKVACAAWRNKAINGRVSKLRMISCIRQIANKNLPNPYPKEESVQKIEEEVQPIHVLGVVPEQEEPKEEPKQEPQEYPKEEKRFFGKRNKNR